MSVTPRARLVVPIAAAATFMASLDLFVVNVAYPELQRAFGGAGDGELSWILNAYAIVLAALPIPLGRLADAYGRRRGFVAGAIVFGIGSALCAAAPSVALLVAARAVQAAGAAVLLPTSLSLLLDELPAERRTRGVAAWSAGGALASAAGVPVGALLMQVSWRAIFLINLPIAAATVVGALLVLRERADRAPGGARRPDLLGALLLIVGVAAITLAIVEGDGWSWTAPRTLASLVLGALALAAFAHRCARHPAPIVDPRLFADRSFVASTASGTAFFAGFGAFVLANVLLLERVWHHDVLRAGLEFAPGPLAVTVVSLTVSARLIGRLGVRAVAIAGALLFALGAALIAALVAATPHYVTAFLLPLLVAGVGIGLVVPALPAAIAAALPPERRATGSAVFAMSRQLGTVLGVALLVALTGASGDALAAHRLVYACVAVLGLLAALLGRLVHADEAVGTRRGMGSDGVRDEEGRAAWRSTTWPAPSPRS